MFLLDMIQFCKNLFMPSVPIFSFSWIKEFWLFVNAWQLQNDVIIIHDSDYDGSNNSVHL